MKADELKNDMRITNARNTVQILKMAARILGALVLLGIAGFAVFGFLAAFEPGNGWEWQVIYGALACGCLFGIIALFRRGGGR
jgi:hypothetical protein